MRHYWHFHQNWSLTFVEDSEYNPMSMNHTHQRQVMTQSACFIKQTLTVCLWITVHLALIDINTLFMIYQHKSWSKQQNLDEFLSAAVHVCFLLLYKPLKPQMCIFMIFTGLKAYILSVSLELCLENEQKRLFFFFLLYLHSELCCCW